MKIYIPLLALFITTFSYCQNATIKSWPSKNYLPNKNEVIHNNHDLDNTIKFSEVDIVATYSSCKNLETNTSKTNCLITKLIIYTTDKLTKSKVLKDTKLKKGTKKFRVLFIIDQFGKIKVKKILGQWPKTVSQEITNIIESAPRLTPAKISGKNVPVKFSIKIPFTIK